MAAVSGKSPSGKSPAGRSVGRAPGGLWLWLALGLVVAGLSCYRQAFLPRAVPEGVAVPKVSPWLLPGHPAIHYNDFKHIWLGSLVLRAGKSPYDKRELDLANQQFIRQEINPYVYPPFTGLVLSPLTWEQDFLQGARRWTALQFLLLLGSLALIFRTLAFDRPLVALAVGLWLLAFSFPLSRTITAGQLNVALLFIYCLIAWLLKTGRHTQVGCWIAFGAWFKMAPGILLIQVLLRRNWRAAAGAVVFGIGILAVTLAWVGPQVHLDYLPLVRQMGYGRSTWADAGMRFYVDPANQSFNALFHHLLADNGVTEPWVKWANGARAANGLTWLASLSMLGLVGWLSVRERPARAGKSEDGERGDGDGAASQEPAADGEMAGEGRPPDEQGPEVGGRAGRGGRGDRELLILSLWIFLSLLLPSLCWDHYLIILFLPQMILLSAVMGRFVTAAPLRAGFVAPLCVWLAGSILLGWMFPFFDPRYLTGAGILLLSHKLFGALVLFGLNVWLVWPPRDGARAGSSVKLKMLGTL
ncbi:glycosyltransferase family 87 protein [Candidatus Sumerlaeota bacterium]